MRGLAFGLVVSLAAAGATMAATAPKPQPNVEAVRAAIDPASGPPIADPVYAGGDTSMGGPGGYWPERALRLNISGVAVIKCTLGDAGALKDCALVAEGPTTLGFSEASLLMAKAGHLKAKPPEGAKLGDPVRVIVVFKNPNK